MSQERAQDTGSRSDRTAVAVEALKRLKGIDLESNPALKLAVLKVLESTKGTPQFVELVREFKIKGQSRALLAFAIEHPEETAGADAIRLVLGEGDLPLIEAALQTAQDGKLIKVLGNTGAKEVVPLLENVAADPKRDAGMRVEAVRALAQTHEGSVRLLNLAQQPGWPEPLRNVAGVALRDAHWPEIKAQAAALLPQATPETVGTLPPISQLAREKGDASRGADVFFRETVGCFKCHQVNGKGTDFGPNLSEIGTKLAKEAIYEAILDPSAGISFGYEAWEVELKNGDEAYGLVASETADELTIKMQNGIVTRYKKSEIARRTQQKTSIMPSGLAQTMSQQDLVDLVEFLGSLKKKEQVAHQ